MMRTVATLVILLVHLGVPVLYNVQGFLQSLHIVKQDDATLGPIARIQRVGAVRPLAAYGRLTGLATGYGFFSPHVASPFTIQAVACAAPDRLCDTLVRPHWAYGSGGVRYRAFTNGLRNLLPPHLQHGQQADSLTARYWRALAGRMAGRMLADRPGSRLAAWQVYVAALPGLNESTITYLQLYADAKPLLDPEPMAIP